MMTIDELKQSPVEYDTAVPQEIWNKIHELTGENAQGHIVVTYPPGMIFGELVAITRTGDALLRKYNEDRTSGKG